MKKLFQFPLFRKKEPSPKANSPVYCAQILGELRQTREALDNAYDRFETEQDEMMLECIIFEIESLRAKYRFWLRTAKEAGVVCDKIKVFH